MSKRRKPLPSLRITPFYLQKEKIHSLIKKSREHLKCNLSVNQSESDNEVQQPHIYPHILTN